VSPARGTRGRQQFVPARPRAEVLTAVAVSATIVIGTALLVWLMRPGQVGVPGGGGLLNRQPRMTMLVVLTAAIIGGWALYVVRRRRPPRFGTQGSIAIGSAITVVLAVVAGIFWPGGVIRHWPKQPKVADVPATSVPSSAPTTAKTGTTAKSGTTSSTATSATTGTTVKTGSTVTTTTVKAG